MKTNTETIARYGDADGEVARLVRRGGHYYIRTEGEEYTRDAGRPYFAHVASRTAGLEEMRARRDYLDALAHYPPPAESDVWAEGLDEEETR